MKKYSRLQAVIFYHPKDPRNIVDSLLLAKSVGSDFIIVPRPGATYSFIGLDLEVKYAPSLEEAISLVDEDTDILVLENYGSICINEVKPKHSSALLIVGAEDYGIPPTEVEKIPRELLVVRIPMSIQGVSYNVVVSIAIALIYLLR